jgi:hypothetical protein
MATDGNGSNLGNAHHAVTGSSDDAASTIKTCSKKDVRSSADTVVVGRSVSGILDLPPELLIHIFQYLSLADRLHFRSVEGLLTISKKWNSKANGIISNLTDFFSIFWSCHKDFFIYKIGHKMLQISLADNF